MNTWSDSGSATDRQRIPLPAFASSSREYLPPIDYASHPAFRDRFVPDFWDNAAVTAAVDRIDAVCHAWQEASTTENPRVALQLSQAMADLEAVLATGPRLDAETQEWLSQAIRATASRLPEELEARAFAPSAPSVAKFGARWQEMARDGFTTVRLPVGVQSTWKQAAEPYRAELLRRSAERPGARQWMALDPYGSLARSLARQLQALGVLQIVGAYRGLAMEIDHIAIHYSHDRQNWFADCYADQGLSTGPLAYLHNDYGSHNVKALCYLDEIGPENGPFVYARGSHAWRRSLFQLVFFKELDRAHAQVFKGRLPAVGHYRARFALPAERARLMLLPTVLQGTSHFGDDLLPEWKLTRQILDREVAISSADSMIVFDGGHGLHRGGLVKSGARWALQIGFRPVVKRHLVSRGRNWIKQTLATLSRRA